jgi:hypothetical protein
MKAHNKKELNFVIQTAYKASQILLITTSILWLISHL